MAAEICADSFLINMLGNLICTFILKNRKSVQAVYGINTYAKTVLYTPGTGADITHPNYGFHVEYDPSPGPPPDSDFPAGVTLAGTFDREPDLSGNLTAAREATFNGTATMDEAEYLGGNAQVRVTLSYNPGVA